MQNQEAALHLQDHWLLDALMDGIVLIDAEWRIVFANAAAARILRLSREAITGKRVGIDLPPPPPERYAVYRDVMERRRMRVMRDIKLEGADFAGHVYEGEVHPTPEGGIALVFRDVTERRRMEQAATRLGRILESSWNEIYIFDAETLLFQQVSRGAMENLGYELEELRSLTPLDLKPELTPESFERLLRPLRSGEQALMALETVHRRRDGSLYPVEVHLQLAGNEHPPVFIAVVMDLTARRQAQEQLEQQAAELEMLNEQLRQQAGQLEEALATRNRFYATMSHELRTPINAVIGYNDLLLSGVYGSLSDVQRQGIERSQRAADHLREIVDDVLDVSRLEAGKVQIEPQEVRLPELLNDLLISVQPLAERHAAPLRVGRFHCGQPIVTDARRVRQILLILLSNAAKFGAGRPIELRCTQRPDGGVALEVADQGPGMSAGELERIFEEFVQLNPADTAEGTGLGLAIARRLAVLLQGQLEVSSAPGKGSTFRLTLPPRIDDRAG